MAIEFKPTKKYFMLGDKQNRLLLTRHKEDQKWLHYLIIGSFGLIVLLNFLTPNFNWIGPKPLNVKIGFMGVILTFLGSVFFFRAFFQSGGENWFDIYWWLSVILCITFLYFGLPIIFG